MPDASASIGDFAVESAALGGALPPKLAALRAAGFAQVVLAADELVDHAAGVDAAVAAVAASGVSVAALGVLHDYEGLSGPLHARKSEIAQDLLALCAAVGCRLLRVEATARATAAGDPDAIARDLRKLAMLAVPKRIRIGYAAAPGARHVRDTMTAWDAICLADAPNLGLVVEAADLLAGTQPLDDLELLDPASIFLVRLADRMEAGEGSAASDRLLPGEGTHRRELAALVVRLAALGYRGRYALSSSDADDRRLPPAAVAARARRSAVWLADDVLRLSAPLPGRLRLGSVR